ncbi:tRNA (adenosine(37)-N6)-threonylcarbamoyltransferase complex transferase subunit TsaD [Deferrisoma camini]|uniref:tRNA (adenosine(37)-N6)-threonylcarbamoyltransferase complex transferase subunit TsaD n=1 Tax=Deferrisoma camini TaxID=1035120 RepID=UPI0004A43EB1|nr:tRNA (adenosine(37)-N6)-threonylcarbamoyltransferase complex transferase subunit TsaD [Deferrisoma camini]
MPTADRQPPTILAIETSCDETAAAVLRGEQELLSDVVASQAELHAEYGGVVPEIACRAHAEAVVPVVRQALRQAGVGLEGLDAVAVTRGPGLVGALLVGLSFAKALAWARGLPLVGVNHLEAHLAAAFLEHDLEFPFVGLVVSGGHTALYQSPRRGTYRLLGQTLDDAAGEAFDKVAKLLGLGYPGGVVVDRLARQGDPERFAFPRPMMGSGRLDFSFSGLKTAVRTHRERFLKGLTEQDLWDTCASFQEAVVDTLLAKARTALERTGAACLVVCGGVACNSRLRERAAELADRLGVRLVLPRPRLCTDNAAMVAAAGLHRFLQGHRSGPDLDAVPTWHLEDL